MSNYKYQEVFYTGTNEQPDVLSFFVKGTKTTFINVRASANWKGYVPVKSSLTGVTRISIAANKIFTELSHATFHPNDLHLHECWNAFRNLFRGILETIPLIGNVTLMIFDLVREQIIFNSKIEQDIAPKENIVGIAIDGTVVFTIDLEYLKKLNPSKTNKKYGEIFACFFIKCLEAEEKKVNPLKIYECILKFKDVIETFEPLIKS